MIQSGFPTVADSVIKKREVEEVPKSSTLPGGYWHRRKRHRRRLSRYLHRN